MGPKCPVRHLPEHQERSCIHGPYHMLFSRELTNEEWSYIRNNVDQYYNPLEQTWHPEGMAYLVRQVSDQAVEKGEDELTIIGFNP